MEQQPRDELEFSRLQLEQSIQTYRTGLTVLAQIITVLIIANGTVVGYALTGKTAGFFFIGALFPLLIIFLTRMVGKLFVPAVFTSYSIEKYFDAAGHDCLMTTGISMICSEEFLEKLEKIRRLSQTDARIHALQELDFSILGSRERMAVAALLLLALGQCLVPFALSTLFSWKLF